MADCKFTDNKFLGVILIKETPFEKGMSISTHQEKRAENAMKVLGNLKEEVKSGNVIIIK